MPKKPYTVAYVSGTRADFGLMLPVLQALEETPGIRLRVYFTGMHLMARFGSTFRQVRHHFPKAQRLSATIPTDDTQGLALFFSQCSQAVTKVFQHHPPDLVLTLGDRAEMLAVAASCLYLGIPTAHIHGGDLSATVDGVARHAITKLSHIHFPATPSAARRILAMGEEPWRVHTVGAPAIDVLKHYPLPSSRTLRRTLGLPINTSILLVTLHPISEDWRHAAQQMREVLSAVTAFPDGIVIAYPNADAGGREMIKVIEHYRHRPHVHIFPSLDYPNFLGLEREADVWIGNSSAGMIESSTWPTPVVNVGPRQSGREHGQNVINVPYDRAAIIRAIRLVRQDASWRRRLLRSRNPWGDGRTGQRIASIINQRIPRERLLAKLLNYD